ncbi:MAG: (2Fe-2S) ferredoxin domain-containing protein [Leptolyngbyaceae cyanobacterium]
MNYPLPNGHPHPPRIFNLEGTFLGFVGGDSRKVKSIILEVDQEEVVIKLPKELRTYMRSAVRVGDRLHCIGSSQIDFKAGVIKLQAYQVFFLSPPELATATPAEPTATATEAPCVPNEATPSPLPKVGSAKKPSHILVCRKSGCQKRGGRKMVAALEQILQTYNLQGQVEIRYTGCQKTCSKAPNLTVMPGKHRYQRVNPDDLSALIEEHFCEPE